MYKTKLNPYDYSPNNPMCLLNAEDIVEEYSLLTDGNGNKLPTKNVVDNEMVDLVAAYMKNVGFKYLLAKGNQLFGCVPIYVNRKSTNPTYACPDIEMNEKLKAEYVDENTQ